MWKDVLINWLQVDKIYSGGLEQCVAEYKKSDKYCNEDLDILMMKVVQFQFSRLPKKIQSGLKILGSENYGNVNLVKKWTSPFSLDTGNEFAIDYPESVSYYQFSYDLGRVSKNELIGIYATCLIYEFLTLGDYVPNLSNDYIKNICVVLFQQIFTKF